ncbi:hypothetical protein D3C77_551030 [compost metagenome]
MLFTRVGRAGKRRTLLCSKQLATQFGKRLAGYLGQHLALADRIASTNCHRIDPTGKLRGHLNRTVAVIANLTEHLQRGSNFRGTSSGERDATLLKLHIRHGHAGLNLLVTERVTFAFVLGADGNLERMRLYDNGIATKIIILFAEADELWSLPKTRQSHLRSTGSWV